MTGQDSICVHVNSRYVESHVHDLDVYDRYTLQRAVQSLAGHINYYMAEGKPEKAAPYTAFKERIKRHLGA
jgi:hypothetical protein